MNRAMPNFIDRRLNPKDKSLGNRQRFLRRAREELKQSIRRADQGRQDRRCRRRTRRPGACRGAPASRASSTRPTAAGATMSCLATRSSRPATASRNRVKAAAAGGTGRSDAARNARTISSFVLSREEVLDLFFEDLELPDMVKLEPQGSSRVQAPPRRLHHDRRARPTSMSGAPCATAMAAASR